MFAVQLEGAALVQLVDGFPSVWAAPFLLHTPDVHATLRVAQNVSQIPLASPFRSDHASPMFGPVPVTTGLAGTPGSQAGVGVLVGVLVGRLVGLAVGVVVGVAVEVSVGVGEGQMHVKTSKKLHGGSHGR